MTDLYVTNGPEVNQQELAAALRKLASHIEHGDANVLSVVSELQFGKDRPVDVYFELEYQTDDAGAVLHA